MTALTTNQPGRFGRVDVRVARLTGVAAFFCVAAAINVIVLAPAWHGHASYVIVHIAVSTTLIGAGLALRIDPTQTGNGALLVLAGAAQTVPVLSWRDVGPSAWVSWVFGPASLLPIAIVLLRYPGAELQHRVERRWVVCAATWLVLGRLATAMFAPTRHWDGWWPVVITDVSARSVAYAVFDVGGAVLAVTFVVMLLQRWHRGAELDRLTGLPVAVAALAIGTAATLHLADFLWIGQSSGGTLALLQDIAVLAVPAAFLAVALISRVVFAEVAAAIVSLPDAATPGDVQAALAAGLHDPGLQVLYWLEDARYVYCDGSAADLTSVPANRLAVPAPAGDGSPLAVVLTDRSAHRNPRLLASAMRLGTLALENTRLQASLLARLAEVRESRARMLEAGLAERRRIERDLHDGTQQRLLAVAAGLGRLRHQLDEPGALAIVDDTRNQLQAALADLRDLAHGIHPALLTDQGLDAAIRDVVERLPLTVSLDVTPRRWPAAVEMTAYFVICEALANVAKHADDADTSITVSGDDTRVLVSVTDCGPGGADIVRGSGLRGLDDRVTAVGGRLTISSTVGAGTHIDAVLPCATS